MDQRTWFFVTCTFVLWSACGRDTQQGSNAWAGMHAGLGPSAVVGVAGTAAGSGNGAVAPMDPARPAAQAAGSSAQPITPARATAGSGPIAGMSGAASGTPAAAGGSASSGTSGASQSGGAGGTEQAGAGMAAAGGGGMSAAAGSGSRPTGPGTCENLPAVTDYKAPGPFNDAKMYQRVGPSNNYTLFRPSASLGKDGFKHPVASWGNGILTTPDMYQKLLLHIASHGFVIIGCNDTQAERPCVDAGMEWLIAQNTASGELQGKLDTSREVAVGYSWGGGAAIDVSDRPNIKATISLHGMPPRVTDIWGKLHAPLLLTTSTGDNFVPAAMYVTPNYQKTVGQTFYATLQDSNAGHLYIADKSAGICIGEVLAATFGTCGDAAVEQAPAVAWLRYWTCGDQGAKPYFYGDDCTMCKSPWGMPQRKMWQ